MVSLQCWPLKNRPVAKKGRIKTESHTKNTEKHRDTQTHWETQRHTEKHREVGSTFILCLIGVRRPGKKASSNEYWGNPCYECCTQIYVHTRSHTRTHTHTHTNTHTHTCVREDAHAPIIRASHKFPSCRWVVYIHDCWHKVLRLT